MLSLSTSADSYMEIDLTDYPSENSYTLTVNSKFSSSYPYRGWIVVTSSDAKLYGYNDSYLKDSSTDTTISRTSSNVLFYGNVNATAKDYTHTFAGGQKYYLHFGYSKSNNFASGDDTLTINSISFSGPEFDVGTPVPAVKIASDVTNGEIQYSFVDESGDDITDWITLERVTSEGTMISKLQLKDGTQSNIQYGYIGFARIMVGNEEKKRAPQLNIIDDTGPNLTLKVTNRLSDQISVKVATAYDLESGMPDNIEYKYYIAENGSEYPSQPTVTTTSNTYTFTELKQTTTYKIKVETENKNGKTGSTEKTTITPTIYSGSYITAAPQWSSGVLDSVYIYKGSGTPYSNYNMQYSTDGDNWTTITTTSAYLTDVNEGDTLYLRYIDQSGTNVGATYQRQIGDYEDPSSTITYYGRYDSSSGAYSCEYDDYGNYKAYVGDQLQFYIELSDGAAGSGIDLSNSRWMFANGYIDQDYVMNNGNTFNSEYDYIYPMPTEMMGYGDYYLYVLAVDYKGNTSLNYILINIGQNPNSGGGSESSGPWTADWTNISNGEYYFVDQGDAWYSNNEGIIDSEATSSWEITANSDVDYTFECGFYGENTTGAWITLDDSSVGMGFTSGANYVTIHLSAGTHTLTACSPVYSDVSSLADAFYIKLDPVMYNGASAWQITSYGSYYFYHSDASPDAYWYSNNTDFGTTASSTWEISVNGDVSYPIEYGIYQGDLGTGNILTITLDGNILFTGELTEWQTYDTMSLTAGYHSLTVEYSLLDENALGSCVYIRLDDIDNI